MNDVQFEEENFNNNYYTMKQQQSFSLSNFLIQKRIAKDEKQANAILLIVAIGLLVMSSFLFINGSRSNLDTVTYDIPDEILISFPKDIQDAIYKNN